jgi:BolA family transcriptional regulator, general stress-responsive regulator
LNEQRVASIRTRLESAFSPLTLEITDDSHRHAGHAGARDGRGHFSVTIVSAKFMDTKPLERHRMVYAALGSLMQTDIHALSVNALSPAEAQ